MSFSEKYNKIAVLVGDEIQKLKTGIINETENTTDINEYLKSFLNLPSKHIRSVVCFLYLKALGINVNEKQVTIQTIIELVHNASLIHDDIIDDCAVRRGQKSFNAEKGNHMAVISGDFILSFALKKIADLNSMELLKMFAGTLNNMCTGEITQQHMKFKIPTIDEYIEKTYNKTASLFETALSGAILIEKGSVNEEAAEFARNFGISFQIRDDILDIIGNKSGKDIENGIYNAPVIYSSNPDKPDEGIEKAKSLLDNYVRRAKSSLSPLPENKYKFALIELLELINNE